MAGTLRYNHNQVYRARKSGWFRGFGGPVLEFDNFHSESEHWFLNIIGSLLWLFPKFNQVVNLIHMTVFTNYQSCVCAQTKLQPQSSHIIYKWCIFTFKRTCYFLDFVFISLEKVWDFEGIIFCSLVISYSYCKLLTNPVFLYTWTIPALGMDCLQRQTWCSLKCYYMLL